MARGNLLAAIQTTDELANQTGPLAKLGENGLVAAVIPIVQKPSENPSASTRESSSGIAAMRSLSNTTLVEEAARKALSAQELQKTIERFRQLCVTPGEDVRPLEEVAEILRNAGFKNELMNLLRDALSLPEANPHVGALWVRRIVTSKIWDHRYPNGLDALCEQGEVGCSAVIEFLDLTGARRRSQLVKTAIARHRKWLRNHARGWGAAGRALVQARCYRQAASWMSRWRERTDLDLPTLHCLAIALRATGRMKEANEVIHLALSRPNAVESFPMFRLWIAQDQALAGHTEKASDTFKQINTTSWDDDSLALYYLVRGVIRAQKAEASSRHETFKMAKERIHELFRRVPIYKRDVFLRHEYRRCLTRMAKDCREPSESVFAVWRSAESSWFLLPLLLVPGLQLFVPCYLYRLCSRRRGVAK